MRGRMVRASTASVLLLIAGCGREQVPPTRSAAKAFVGARLIDGTGGSPTATATLIVREGRVTVVGPEDAIDLPEGASPVDVSGKTIVPGLVVAHAHVGATRGLESGPGVYTDSNVLD